jgi:tRNA1(Val) A37 N6-methylase TrmN6
MKFVTDLSKGILGTADSSEMWANIVKHIPDSILLKSDARILNICCGHGTEADIIVQRMKDLGLSTMEIQDRIYLLDKYHVFTNRAKRKGYINVITTNFLEWTPEMKFDVTFGNPPYQDPNNDKRMLWNQVIDKAVEVTADDGYIAMVNPTTWLTAKTNIHNSYKMFEQKQVERAVIYDKNDKPFEEGTSVSYTITKNTKRAVPTPLYYAQYSTGIETHVADINIAKDKIWPGQLTPMHLAIHNRLQTHKKIKFLKSCEFHNQKLKKKKMVSDVQDPVFQYTHHVSAAITRYTNTKFSNHATWKVMVPLTSTIDRAVVDNNCGHGEDMLSLYVADQKIADNIKTVFNTQLYKFIGKLYKSGRNQPLQNLFPIVDFTRTWTDDELNDHFGFTQEERDYIANFK